MSTLMQKINITSLSLDILLIQYWELFCYKRGVVRNIHVNGLNQIEILMDVLAICK